LKLRNISNLPVFDEQQAKVIGKVDKAIIGDDSQLAYLVIDIHGQGQKMLLKEDFLLTEDSVIIKNSEGMKSYAYGEELTIYDKKLGDVVYDYYGKELGIISDFVVSPAEKQICGLEISSGALQDLLEGRQEVPLDKITWKNNMSIMIDAEGREFD